MSVTVWLYVVIVQVFGCGVLVGLSIADWQADRERDRADSVPRVPRATR